MGFLVFNGIVGLKPEILGVLGCHELKLVEIDDGLGGVLFCSFWVICFLFIVCFYWVMG